MSSSIKTTWRGKEVTVNGRRAAAAAIKMGLEHILEESNRVIPHEEGVLQDSGAVSLDSSSLEGTVYYDTPYAVKQHEDTTLQHDGGRKHHYLEDTVNSSAQEVLRFIQEELRAALGG